MKNFVFLCLSLLLLSCATGRKQPVISQGQQEISRAKVSMQEEYKISPLDVLEVSVYQEEDLRKVVRVSQDGFITYPFAGKLKVTGLTVIQLEQQLTDLLGKDYFVNPQVSVFVKEYHSRKVYVIGQVKSPGSYDFLPEKPLTVLEVITLAGGFTDIASPNRTKVLRVQNGVETSLTVKIDDITSNGDKNKDIVLEPNDIVVVPEKIF